MNTNIKNNQYILNISQTNLLKDNQIQNSNNISKKILNNFCYNLHKMEMEIITQKNIPKKFLNHI